MANVIEPQYAQRGLSTHWKNEPKNELKIQLIIHEEKTKEIPTAKKVWIGDPNYHKIWWTFALNFSKNNEYLEKLYQTLERVFHLTSQ